MAIDRKEQRKQQQRQEILDAAERVFAQQGYHSSTMDAVAEECGWSKGTLYLHFEHKEDLFFSLLISKMELLSELVVNDVRKAHTLPDILEALIVTQFKYFKRHKEFLQLAISEQGKVMQASSSGMREQMVEQQTNYIMQIAELMAAHIRPDSLISPVTFTQAVTGAIHIQMMAWLLQPEHVDLDVVQTELKELYLNGISLYAKN